MQNTENMINYDVAFQWESTVFIGFQVAIFKLTSSRSQKICPNLQTVQREPVMSKLVNGVTYDVQTCHMWHLQIFENH
jgi:hypothetical protein